MQKYKAIAPAKINLNLFIGEKCENGLHLLSSIFLPISLTDKLSFNLLTNSKDKQIHFKCSIPQLENKQNLVYQAAMLWQKLSKAPYSWEIFLEKSIPSGAGLGGGSSDAATTLLYLQKMSGEYALDKEELAELAFDLGSDVPYFLEKGLALVEGQGDKITSLPWPGKFYFLLIKPDIHVSTAEAFSQLDEARINQYTDEQNSHTKRKNVKNILLHNDFTEIVASKYPQAKEILDYVKLNGADFYNISGSGPTVYAIYQDKDKRDFAFLQAAKDLPLYQLYACESLSNTEIQNKEVEINDFSL